MVLFLSTDLFKNPGHSRLLSIFEKLPNFKNFTTDTDKHGQDEDFKPEVRVFRAGQWLNFFKIMMAL
jgi:hypothetical protein